MLKFGSFGLEEYGSNGRYIQDRDWEFGHYSCLCIYLADYYQI